MSNDNDATPSAIGQSRFCEHCDVSLDLHPTTADDPQPWSCQAAEAKADLIAGFGRMFRA